MSRRKGAVPVVSPPSASSSLPSSSSSSSAASSSSSSMVFAGSSLAALSSSALSSSGAGGGAGNNNSGMMTVTPTASQFSSGKVLADVFNKIAEFEVCKTNADYLHMMDELQLDASEKAAVERVANTEFNKLLLDLESLFAAEDVTVGVSTNETISRCKERTLKFQQLFSTQLEAAEKFEAGKQAKLPEFKTLSRQASALNAEKNALVHSIEMCDHQIKEMQEICRSGQKKNKEALEEVEKIRQAGISRTFSLGQSCQLSIDEVLGSLHSEEESMMRKAEENEDLSKKLVDFKAHLAAHSRQIQAHKRALDLQTQLVAAKKAQVAHHDEQCRLLTANYTSRMHKQYEALFRLQEQVSFYKTKFAEFENSIDDTRKVFLHFEAKAKEATDKALSLEDGTSKILKKAEAKHNELDRLKKERAQMEEDKVAIEKECATYEKLCRTLASERMSVSKELKDLQILAEDVSKEDLVEDQCPGVIPDVNDREVGVAIIDVVEPPTPTAKVGGDDPVDSLEEVLQDAATGAVESMDSPGSGLPVPSSSSSSLSSNRRGITAPLSPGED
jgi:hypothetical protein